MKNWTPTKRTVTDPRFRHEFNNPIYNPFSIERLRFMRNYFISNATKYFPMLLAIAALGVAFVGVEAISAAKAEGLTDPLDYDGIMKSEKFAKNYKTWGPYNSLFKCFKREPGCGKDYEPINE